MSVRMTLAFDKLDHGVKLSGDGYKSYWNLVVMLYVDY